jgi:hypothetical protein
MSTIASLSADRRKTGTYADRRKTGTYADRRKTASFSSKQKKPRITLRSRPRNNDCRTLQIAIRNTALQVNHIVMDKIVFTRPDTLQQQLMPLKRKIKHLKQLVRQFDDRLCRVFASDWWFEAKTALYEAASMLNYNHSRLGVFDRVYNRIYSVMLFVLNLMNELIAEHLFDEYESEDEDEDEDEDEALSSRRLQYPYP